MHPPVASAMADLVRRIRSQIGWLGTERIVHVEGGHVHRFAQAIGDDDPRWQKFAPPTFTVMMLNEPPDLPAALEYGSGWLNAGDHFEYLEPVRIGDVLRSRTKLTDVFEKRGSTDKLLFLIFETEFRNQNDRVAVRHTGTRLRR